MKIFITGGSGFLGRHLIQRLSSEGHDVSALSRSKKSDKFLQSLGAQIVSGSLDDIQNWERNLEGHDIVVHCAAPLEFWGPWEKFYTDITVATQKLLDASHRHNIKKFIFISSESVLQNTAPLLDINETYPQANEPNSYYGKAKKLAEDILLKAKVTPKIIIIRPPYIWGKDDNGIPQILEKVRKGQFVWLDHGQIIIETAHVDNVVEAIIRAFSCERDKSIYFVTDDAPVKVREFFEPLFKLYNVPIPTKNVPNLLAKVSALMIEKVWKFLGIKNNPPLSVFEWAFVGMPRRYNISKIKSELGYKPVTTREKGVQQIAQARGIQ